MNIQESIKMASVDIRVNKMRTFLSMLGIVIGIASVIIIVSIGNGLKFKILDQFSGLGANRLYVAPGWDEKTQRMGEISLNDIPTIRALPGINNVTPQISWNADVKSSQKSQPMDIRGVTEDYFSINGMQLDKGRLLTSTDMDLRASVCVLKPQVAMALFGNSTSVPSQPSSSDDEIISKAVGKSIKIGEHRFIVAGVLTRDQNSMSFLYTGPNTIFVPVTLLLRISQQKSIQSISVEIEDTKNAKKVTDEITKALNERHQNKGRYEVINPEDFQKEVNTALNIFTMVIGAIGGLSLLVGGIGIMNIMLASVAERTREVGIRKAIGAKRRDILIQFLVEAGAISGCGGVVGIILGIALAKSIAILSQDNIPSVILPSSILIAFIFSVIVGMFFGIYPSSKAANLNPIEALRYE